MAVNKRDRIGFSATQGSSPAGPDMFIKRTSASNLSVVNSAGTAKNMTVDTLAATTVTATTLTATTLGGTPVGVGLSVGARCTTQTVVVSSTTLTNITGMSVSVAAAGVYALRGVIHGSVENTGTNCGYKIGVGGTATLTSGKIQANGYLDDAITLRTTSTALGTVLTEAAAGGADYDTVEISGCLVINAAGTITFQIAQATSHADDVIADVNSWMLLTRIA